MKIKILFFCIILFIKYSAQGGLDAISALNKITPTSPNSSNFEKYGMNPVNLSAGVVSPSIPLVTIPAGNISFSVNLNYSTQGIRVDEFASIVGMGWSVNLGSITRNIRDLDDEKNGTLKDLPSLTGDNLFYVGNSLSQDLALDSEYDVFNVNVDGLSTKFMLESDANLNFTIKKLTKDNIKVEFAGVSDNISNSDPNSAVLLITSPNGTKYYFGGNGGVETSFTRPFNVGGIPPTMHTTAWMISRIEYVNQKKIDFYYTQNQITYNDGISQSATIKFAVPDNKNSGLPQLLGANTSVTYNRNKISVPDRIVSEGITVKFNKSVFTNYINDYPNINSIELKYNDKVNKKIIFNYGYYQSINKGSNVYSEPTNRAFLTKLEFQDVVNHLVNDYRFEYYNPEQIPHRLSFSQDLLGYYNGSNNSNFIFNSLKDYDVLPGYNIIKQTPDEFNNFIYSVAGNRRPNINHAVNGSLKKIIYPTKGYTLFEYDGNRTDIREMVYPPYNTNLSIQIVADEYSQMNPSTAINNVTVPFDQNFYITNYGNSKEDVMSGSPICESDPMHDKSVLTIYENNLPVTIYTVSSTGNISSSSNEVYTIGSGYFFDPNSQVRKYVKLKANKTYRIGLSNRKCMSSVVGFAYYDSVPYPGDYIEAGGLRVKNIINRDHNENQTSKKSYDYVGGAYINGKPISVLDRKDIEIQMLSESGLNVIDIALTKDYTITSGTRNSTRNSAGEFYAYNKVIEYDYDSNNMSKGRTEHSFDVYQIAPPIAIQNYDTASSNFIEMVSSINETKTEFFDNNAIKVKSISYNFSLNQNYLNLRHNSFTAKKTLEIKCSPYGDFNSSTDCGGGTGGIHVTADPGWWSIMKSYKGEIWETLNSKTSTDYINGSALLTSTEYFYNNTSHFQLTQQKTTFPDQSFQTIDFSYAYEKDKALLVQKNMIEIPLETETKKNGKTISKTETIYPDVLPDTQTGNLLLPQSVSSLDLVTGRMSTEVIYDQYDTKGNLQQYTTKSGVSTAIVWGYNNTQPIAKIEGAKYSQVSAYISNIVSKSNADSTNGTPQSEQDLVNELDLFRQKSELSGFQITTYSYDPLIGVKSITPPSGVRQVYIYDTANRLMEIREHSQTGNLLKEYQYNYKH